MGVCASSVSGLQNVRGQLRTISLYWIATLSLSRSVHGKHQVLLACCCFVLSLLIRAPLFPFCSWELLAELAGGSFSPGRAWGAVHRTTQGSTGGFWAPRSYLAPARASLWVEDLCVSPEESLGLSVLSWPPPGESESLFSIPHCS